MTLHSPTRRLARGVAAAFLAACVLLALPLNAHASTAHVIDEVDFISDSTEAKLEAQIQQISATYGQDIVVLYRNLEDGDSPMEVADDFFDYEGYGLGVDRSGVLLLISPSTRDWWVSTRGESIRTFTDKGIQILGEAIVEPLSNNDWEGGAKVFVAQTEVFMEAAANGSPIMQPPRTATELLMQKVGGFFSGIVGGLAAGLGLVHSFFVKKMKNEGLEPAAGAYVQASTLNVLDSSERFITTHVTRTAKPKESSSGSSTHTSSSGATHGGGGGKF